MRSRSVGFDNFLNARILLRNLLSFHGKYNHPSTRGFLCNNHPKASFILQNLGLLLQKAKHGSSCSLCIIDHSLMFKRLGSENLSPPKYPNLPIIKYEKSQISQFTKYKIWKIPNIPKQNWDFFIKSAVGSEGICCLSWVFIVGT